RAHAACCFRRRGAHRALPSFPTRRSSDLGGAAGGRGRRLAAGSPARGGHRRPRTAVPASGRGGPPDMIVYVARRLVYGALILLGDRKSTRLNSSHVKISYAVFCLKKKNDR